MISSKKFKETEVVTPNSLSFSQGYVSGSRRFNNGPLLIEVTTILPPSNEGEILHYAASELTSCGWFVQS